MINTSGGANPRPSIDVVGLDNSEISGANTGRDGTLGVPDLGKNRSAKPQTASGNSANRRRNSHTKSGPLKTASGD